MTRTRLPLPEPVDYQIRLAGGRWTHCAKHIHEAAIKSGAAETRALYSADQMISFRAADNAALRAEVERLREALTKIDAVRNDIIGRQRIGWSSHIYPLVAALDAAGYPGKSYEEAREELAARKAAP